MAKTNKDTVKKIINKKSKKDDDNFSDNDVLEVEEIPKKKPIITKKSANPVKKNTTNTTNAPKNTETENGENDDFEDELSDFEDIIDDDLTLESSDHDNIMESTKVVNKPPQYKITVDPTTPIGELSIDQILVFLGNKGKETLNPTLRAGAFNLKKRLHGGGRRPGSKAGSKSGRHNNNNYNSRPVQNYPRQNSYPRQDTEPENKYYSTTSYNTPGYKSQNRKFEQPTRNKYNGSNTNNLYD